MRKILFLDFDGVLHIDGDPDGKFSRLPRLEEYLLQMPDIEIVVSSAWREFYSLEQIKEFFPITLRDRIIGITPVLTRSSTPRGRQRDVEAFLDAASLHELNAAWIALDDMKGFFDNGCPYLMWVDPARGFGEQEGRDLLAWYRTF